MQALVAGSDRTRRQRVRLDGAMSLSDEQLDRYARHIVLSEIGGEGQRKLLRAEVVVIGAGGIGSPAIQYLAAAGIGALRVVDDDAVARDAGGLQRGNDRRPDALPAPGHDRGALNDFIRHIPPYRSP